MKRACIALALTTAFGIAGCKPRGGDEAEIRAALPAAESVKIALPGGSSKPTQDVKSGRDSAETAATLGETATFYAFTRTVSGGLNLGAAFVLITVRTIVAYPVTSIEGDTYIWGPWTDSLNPAEYRLTVRQDDDGSYLWSLEGRRKADGPTAPFLAIVAGDAMPGAPIGRGSGSFTMDFDVAEQLDPVGNNAEGQIDIVYDLSGDPRWVTMDASSSGGSFHYEYLTAANGTGDFQFTIHTDIDNNGSAQEDAAIRSRWQPTGDGRSDVQISGGDAGTTVLTVSECWDSSFARSYYTDSLNWQPTEGDPASCAFSDVLLPGQ